MKHVLCTLTVLALVTVVGCAGATPKVVNAATASSVREPLLEPWPVETAAAPAVPVALVEKRLVFSRALFPDVPNATFDSCGTLASPDLTIDWSCIGEEARANLITVKSGSIEVDFSKAQPGVYDLTVVARSRGVIGFAADIDESWPDLRATLAANPALAPLISCVTPDGLDATSCTVRVEVLDGQVLPAAGRVTETDMRINAAEQARLQAEAEAEAAAIKLAEEAQIAPQEFYAPELPSDVAEENEEDDELE